MTVRELLERKEEYSKITISKDCEIIFSDNIDELYEVRRELLGRLDFGSIRALMLFILASLILVSLWLYVTSDEQVFMHNINLIAEVFKHRLETITHVEVILLVILGVILFKKMS